MFVVTKVIVKMTCVKQYANGLKFKFARQLLYRAMWKICQNGQIELHRLNCIDFFHKSWLILGRILTYRTTFGEFMMGSKSQIYDFATPFIVPKSPCIWNSVGGWWFKLVDSLIDVSSWQFLQFECPADMVFYCTDVVWQMIDKVG